MKFKNGVGMNMNEQEFQKLKMDCELYKSKVERLEKETAEQEKRISELEKRSEKTDFQYEQIMKMLDKLTEVTIPELSKEIQMLKNKPAERYNTVVIAIISGVVGAIISFISTKILNK